MKKYIPFILSAWLVIGFTLVAGKIFSQVNPKENQTPSADSLTASPGETSAYVTGITTGRARALVGVAAGLISLIAGWRAKVRSSGAGNKRTGALVALVLGLISMVISVVHLSISAGAVFGSGSGKAGAIFALVLASSGMILGWLALRFRKVV